MLAGWTGSFTNMGKNVGVDRLSPPCVFSVAYSMCVRAWTYTRVDVCLVGETRVGRVLSVLRFSDLPNAIIEERGEGESTTTPQGGKPCPRRRLPRSRPRLAACGDPIPTQGSHCPFLTRAISTWLAGVDEIQNCGYFSDEQRENISRALKMFIFILVISLLGNLT